MLRDACDVWLSEQSSAEIWLDAEGVSLLPARPRRVETRLFPCGSLAALRGVPCRSVCLASSLAVALPGALMRRVLIAGREWSDLLFRGDLQNVVVCRLQGSALYVS